MTKFQKYMKKTYYNEAELARGVLGISRQRFWEKKTEFRGAKFNALERERLTAFLGIDEDELFGDDEDE